MLDMGFKPQVDKIVRRISSDRQTMFFSATLDGEVGELARLYTRFPVRIEAELADERAYGEIAHRFVPVTRTTSSRRSSSCSTPSAGSRSCSSAPSAAPTGSRSARDRTAFDALAMHGDMTQAAREKALARFEAARSTTLIATDVAARGLDLDDITLVINYDPPEDDKAYTHRVGRTGRAGRSGTGVTLVLPEQQADVSRVARLNGQTDKFEETGMKIAAPKLVYSSRGRNSKWGPVRPRRKI